jgi:hypothetical protein
LSGNSPLTLRTHVFAIALPAYRDSRLKGIEFAEADVKSFVAAWQTIGAAPTDSVALIGEQATRASFMSRWKKFLLRIGKSDRIVLYYVGHAFSEPTASYLTTYTTQWNKRTPTSISFAELLQTIETCESSEVLLFLDLHRTQSSEPESSLPDLTQSEALPTFELELQEFCQQGAKRAAFLSCSKHESTYCNRALGHGIWNHTLVRTLTGESFFPSQKPSRLTQGDLQRVLAAEVPRVLRETMAGTATQSPVAFGRLGDECVIVDLTNIKAGSQTPEKSSNTESTRAWKDARLRGEQNGEIKRLTGFRKGLRLPDNHSEYAETLIKTIGHNDVKSQAERIYDDAVAAFDYRRRDISFTCDQGAATMITPDFRVDLSIQQSADDFESYRLNTEVGSIRRPAVVGEKRFSQLFANYCDTILIELVKPVSVQDKIDEIEDVPTLRKQLTYAPDCTWLALELTDPQIRIRVTSDCMTLTLPGKRNLESLLKNSQAALNLLAGTGIALFLPD